MHRLIFYELDKIWRKRSFILSICVLMIINLFLLWYINTPELKGTTEENYIDELYEEQQKVAGYKEYLRSVQESKDNLSSISIFKKQGQNDYAARNIEKSAKDYSGLSGKNIRWMPSKSLKISMESVWTDLLLILSVLLFSGNLIFAEKGKKLFYITRSTKNGRLQSGIAKIAALFVHCTIITILFYGMNLIYAEITIGFGDLTADIQSVAIYMESNLQISILEYIIYSVLTKGFVFFATGNVIMAFCIFADRIVLPYVAAFLLYGISYIAYLTIPAVEKWSVFKYINLIGILETQKLYGSYLNFNIGGYPVSRLVLTRSIIIDLAISGITLSILLFVYGRNFELVKSRSKHKKHFHPHISLLYHEGYKIMITNRAVVVILLFAILIGWQIIGKEYNPSAQEQYYRDIMLQLEGKMTDEKEALIISEQEKYDKAFSEIERIDNMTANGKISENAADGLKAELYAVTFFYPAFERVQHQYQRICENGGSFIYDTGYLYLFGLKNNDLLINLFLLSLCVVAAFGNVIPMEYQCGVWYLLGATKAGKKKIIYRKAAVCIMAVMGLSIIPVICRFINISKAYPMHGAGAAITDIPYFEQLPPALSIRAFIILLILAQMGALIVVAAGTLVISYWRKNHIQSVFFSILVFVVPLILKISGIGFAGWFSVFPLYSWTTLIGA